MSCCYWLRFRRHLMTTLFAVRVQSRSELIQSIGTRMVRRHLLIRLYGYPYRTRTSTVARRLPASHNVLVRQLSSARARPPAAGPGPVGQPGWTVGPSKGPRRRWDLDSRCDQGIRSDLPTGSGLGTNIKMNPNAKQHSRAAGH